VIHFLQMYGQSQSQKLTLGDVGVFSIVEVFLQARADFFGDVRENVAGPQLLGQASDQVDVSGRIDLR
jgi:hypothetical protein